MKGAMPRTNKKGGARAEEVEALRTALEKIQREASRRFEGESCPRCLAIEALAAEALRSSQQDQTSPINVRQLEELLEQKKD
jgi:hypothetical protein